MARSGVFGRSSTASRRKFYPGNPLCALRLSQFVAVDFVDYFAALGQIAEGCQSGQRRRDLHRGDISTAFRRGHKVVAASVLGALLCLIGACGLTEGGPPSVSVFAEADTLATGISNSALQRQAQIDNASNEEALYLAEVDYSITQSVQQSPRYSAYLRLMAERAGIDASTQIWVDDDLRNNDRVQDFIGGYTGDTRIVLDGKFLDILWEISNYLAVTGTLDRDAVSRIVVAQNMVRGYPGAALLYPRSRLTRAQVEAADELFGAFAGTLLYHEFAHRYLAHTLVKIRAVGTASAPRLWQSSANEDAADTVAGMLLAKAGYPLVHGQQMIDLMYYYGAQRAQLNLSYGEIADNATLQVQTLSAGYSSLAMRKGFIADGYERYSALSSRS